MISTHWLESRKPHWSALERLLNHCGKSGVGALNRVELRELSLLYRQIAADLSTLREDSGAQNYARYLNQLLGRAHNIIYTGKKTSIFRLWHFFRNTYPRVFREQFRYVFAAAVLFFSAALAGALLTLHDPGFQLQLLGPDMVRTIERREMWTHSIVAMKPLASSAIMTNNLSVSFMTFASGITAGLGTAYMLLTNGLLLGVIGMACWIAGMSMALWSFVALHGVLEIPAILIAGGAGLLIGRGMVFPGFLPRKQSLALAGTEAVQLIAGTIPMLVVAGLIEGFVSPTNVPAILRFPLAALLFALLIAYLMGGTESKLKADRAP